MTAAPRYPHTQNTRASEILSREVGSISLMTDKARKGYPLNNSMGRHEFSLG
jgi:hypothetical protein